MNRRRPDPTPAPEHYRSDCVPANELGPLLSRWHEDGFTGYEYEIVGAPEGAGFGPPPQPMVFVLGWVPDGDDDESEGEG